MLSILKRRVKRMVLGSLSSVLYGVINIGGSVVRHVRHLGRIATAMHQKACKPAVLRRAWLATRRALSLEYSQPHQFGCCQWQVEKRPSIFYLIYRCLLFFIVLSIAGASFASQRLPKDYKGPLKKPNYMKWFIYFTNWGFLLIVIQSGLALIVVLRYRKNKSLNISATGPDETYPGALLPRTPLLCRFYWLVHVIATDFALVITLVYWIRVHDPAKHELNAVNILVHGCNSLIMLMELAVTSHSFRFAHALHSAVAGLVYGIFSAVYWALGGTDRGGLPAIYTQLDWSKPGAAIGFVALCAVVMIMAHALATSVTMLRLRVANRWRTSRLGQLSLPTH